MVEPLTWPRADPSVCRFRTYSRTFSSVTSVARMLPKNGFQIAVPAPYRPVGVATLQGVVLGHNIVPQFTDLDAMFARRGRSTDDLRPPVLQCRVGCVLLVDFT